VALVELDPQVNGRGVLRTSARIERRDASGPWFPWARVGPDGIDRVAMASRLGLLGQWEEDGRWFASLIKA
jgi:hypothetical protein